ncbi:MAG: uroporphyrinogen decarboxylase family protein [Lactococcus raffinolactis]|jgi:uroporphyrinogen decarboxylase|uniref:uroporphyrinogen decarboxylase family protein n=1 Tax=Pseudolactococcus raffinolactis TaxID=1366 RepID=UPI001C708B2D|nr:uroporphyrinogen decarboxylase family protein [Lactococcus raffinolactis]MBW9297216.1 uroporphyrinogen decarboxylase [Lactococcus raffinolactis]MCH4162553.1 uroporphyrinogen decarboxylase [Lactococcus raffinolactis]
MSEKRVRFQAVLDGEAVDRIPTGFWYHFFKDELVEATSQADLIADNVTGHQKFISNFEPDFIKLMSDGYFHYPNASKWRKASDEELLAVTSIGKDHVWLTEQAELVKSQHAQFSEDIFSFYNIFAPATYLKFALGGDDQLVNFVNGHSKQAIQHIFDIVSLDIADLAVAVIKQGSADGIYYSTQNIQSTSDQTIFNQWVKPSDLTVLKAAKAAGGTNVLHICGYEGASNRLTDFSDYPADIVNWATAVEGVTLSQGRSIFPNQVLLGGFGNTTKDVLYQGTIDDIAAATQAIITAFGDDTRFLIGADCTVPRDIDLKHLQAARKAAVKQPITV